MKENEPKIPDLEENLLWDQFGRTLKISIGSASFIRQMGRGDYSSRLVKLEGELVRISYELNKGTLAVSDAIAQIKGVYVRIKMLAKKLEVPIETKTDQELIEEYEKSSKVLNKIFKDMTEPEDPNIN